LCSLKYLEAFNAFPKKELEGQGPYADPSYRNSGERRHRVGGDDREPNNYSWAVEVLIKGPSTGGSPAQGIHLFAQRKKPGGIFPKRVSQYHSREFEEVFRGWGEEETIIGGCGKTFLRVKASWALSISRRESPHQERGLWEPTGARRGGDEPRLFRPRGDALTGENSFRSKREKHILLFITRDGCQRRRLK